MIDNLIIVINSVELDGANPRNVVINLTNMLDPTNTGVTIKNIKVADFAIFTKADLDAIGHADNLTALNDNTTGLGQITTGGANRLT